MRAEALLLSALCISGCGAGLEAPRAEHRHSALPTKLAAEVRDAERLGRAIFEQDLASSRASSAVLREMGAEPDERVEGWISREQAGRWRVQFFGGQDPFVTLWEAEVASFGATVGARRLEPPEPLDREGTLMARARATALGRAFRACSNRYNTVVLPPSESRRGGFLVYILAATDTDGDWTIGGHHRFLVSEDGRKLIEHLPLSRGCMAVPASPSHGRSGAWVTHVVSETPSEAHVFLSLLHQAPLFVGTRRGVWKVAGERVTFHSQ